MIGKKSICTSLIAMLIFSMAIVSVNVGAYTPPSVPPHAWFYIDPDPKEFFTETDLTSTYFNITVNIYQDPANITAVQGYEFKLKYNDTLINATAIYKGYDPAGTTWGPVGGPPAYPWKPLPNATIDPVYGKDFVWVIAAFPLGSAISTNFTTVTITFHIKMAPVRGLAPPLNRSVSTILDLYDTVLGNPAGLPITHGVDDGFYEYTRPQIVPGAPTASFLYPSFVYVSTDVTLTDTSTPNGGVIVSWDWSLTGPATWTTPNNQSTRTFHCDGPGTVTVTLNVTDSEGMWDVSDPPPYGQIEQVEVIGAMIDLFTENGRQYPEGTWTEHIGKGPHADADAYSPGENVTLYANVTYNGDIVQNIIVAFEVKHPLGQETGVPHLVRTARTNESGIATISFRLPIPGPTYPEVNETAYFGHWFVIAKCKLQDDIINDTLMFDVDWIVRIIGLETFPYDEWYKSEYIGINVTLKNIAWIPRWVTLVVTVYDDCDVPIGQIVDVVWMDAIPMVCHPYVDSFQYYIHVPKWAYVGAGKVYANAFTELPQQTGVPYCPEMSHDILIKVGTRP